MFNKNICLLVLLILIISVFNVSCSPADEYIEQGNKADSEHAEIVQTAVNQTNEATDWKAWSYDHPYHLILNLAIGGVWGRAGGPIDDSIFPLQMEIDYVRVYKKDPINSIAKL